MNPDRRVHASETCLVTLCALVTLGLLAAVVALLVEAY